MSYRLPFEKYEIYQLAVNMYGLTKSWPKTETYGMISQIQRASTSVRGNIAESTCRFSEKKKARLIEIAFGSLMEVAHFLYMAENHSYITNADLIERKLLIDKLSNKKMLCTKN